MILFCFLYDSILFLSSSPAGKFRHRAWDWVPKSIKNLTKNQPKILQNPSKIRLLGALGASCGALGGVLGHLGSKSQHNHQKADSLDPPGPPKLEPRSTRNSLKLVPEASQRVMIFFIDSWVQLWCHWVPTWLQLGRPNPSKIQPCWSQDPSKIGSRCQPICGLIFDRPGTLFFLIFLPG